MWPKAGPLEPALARVIKKKKERQLSSFPNLHRAMFNKNVTRKEFWSTYICARPAQHTTHIRLFVDRIPSQVNGRNGIIGLACTYLCVASSASSRNTHNSQRDQMGVLLTYIHMWMTSTPHIRRSYINYLRLLPPNHLLLDRSPNIGPLISSWELDKFKNCWNNKRFRTSKILTLLCQRFLNLLISQWDTSGPRLGTLSNNRRSEGTKL